MEILIIGFIIVVVLFWALGGKDKKPRSLSGGSKATILSPYLSKDGTRYQVTGEQLCKACGMNAHNYVKIFSPDNDYLQRASIGSIAGGSVGGLALASSMMGFASSSYLMGYLQASVMDNAFESDPNESTEAIDRLAELAAKGELNSHELTKAMASLLFRDGRGKPNFIEFDKLGSPTFKDDKHRLASAMVYQLFKSNVPPQENVLRLTEGGA
ncbi:hypothetical protein [Vibrio alginolyticus]|uniref:hypothetical protein n=1 Tax=Vibrio alginolyticus TaxID=663 RepID=UPI000802FBFD|nr:hypothetical protein [Vibrio alginolyticus]ANP65828.1 hypothetical protein BAU10_12945 [Vibrio alginolyticus]